MKFEDYKQQIIGLINDPDTALTKVDGIFENLQADIEARDSFESKIKEQEDRIRALQDTNMKLFLKASGEVEEPKDEEEKPKTIEEKFDELVKGEVGNE